MSQNPRTPLSDEQANDKSIPNPLIPIVIGIIIVIGFMIAIFIAVSPALAP